jgi:hypothetical protein
MSDPKKPPPRFPRPSDPEVVRVTEDETPATERVPLPLPPPQQLPAAKPVELRLHRGRESSYVELSAQISATQQTLASVAASQTEVLAVQRKTALQVDGLGRAMNERFNIFHKELAILRARVLGDHAPRLDAAEEKAEEALQRTTAEKAKTVAKGGGLVSLLILAGGVAAELWPQYGDLIRGILGLR